MLKKYSKGLVLAAIAAAMMIVQGCSGAATGMRDSTSYEGGGSAEGARLASAPGQLKQLGGSEETLAGSGSGRGGAVRLSLSDVETMLVYFDFNQFTIRADMRPGLDRLAQYLLENPRTRIQIEGHTDERGTPEYNIALGYKRADSVRSYLLNLGVTASRMKTVSYGEERPVATGHDEAAWQKNRRAKFNIISGFTGRRN